MSSRDIHITFRIEYAFWLETITDWPVGEALTVAGLVAHPFYYWIRRSSVDAMFEYYWSQMESKRGGRDDG